LLERKKIIIDSKKKKNSFMVGALRQWGPMLDHLMSYCFHVLFNGTGGGDAAVIKFFDIQILTKLNEKILW